jgi:DNA-binding transcriptional MerR regulator
MPYKERDITKQYFTIGEVADQFGVATSLIRFWETEFDELRPRKSKKGNRLFTQADVDTFRTIYHLVKERGYTIPGAREMMKQKGGQLKEKIDVIQSLEKVRGFLVSLKKEIDALIRKEPTNGRPLPRASPYPTSWHRPTTDAATDELRLVG